MLAEVTLGPRAVPRARFVVAGETARRAVRSGALWGCVFGLYVAAQALTYASSYKTPASRERLAGLFGTNAGISALNGPAHEIQTVAGFTAWKCLMVLSVMGAVFGLLTATRLVRAEEDAGRWELLLAGRTTRRGACAQALGGLAAGLGAFFVVLAAFVVLVGRSHDVGIGAGGALFFALCVTASPALFLCVGVLTSQLFGTRRRASAYAAGILGVGYALRMVADSGTGLEWLRWATPLGWVEELQPLTHPRPWVLVPVAALCVALGGAAIALAGRRDLGSGVLAERSHRRPRTTLLSGQVGLSVRLSLPVLSGWVLGLCAYALLLGLVAKSGGQALTASAAMAKAIARLGIPGAGAQTYLGVVFLMTAVLLALVGAGQVSAMRSEEADGHLDNLVVRRVARPAWLAGRLLVAVVALAALGVGVGLFAWAGAASQHAGVPFSGLVQAGANIVPPALCLLGLGTLVFGAWPRAATPAAYGLVAWSLLVELIGGSVGLNHFVLDTSIFHQMTAAPAVAPDWTSALAMVLLGLVAALAGGAAFARRDLQGE